jgi:hypothetical protein
MQGSPQAVASSDQRNKKPARQKTTATREKKCKAMIVLLLEPQTQTHSICASQATKPQQEQSTHNHNTPHISTRNSHSTLRETMPSTKQKEGKNMIDSTS